MAESPGLCSLTLRIPLPLAAGALATDWQPDGLRPSAVFVSFRLASKLAAGKTNTARRLRGRLSWLRRDRDSNPGNSYPFTAFRVRPDRPLRHLSKSVLAFRPQIYYLFHYINMENTFFSQLMINIGVLTSPV